MEKARPVSLKEIRIRDNFWDKYRRLVREEILKYQWCAMNDQIEGAPKSHCIENFRIAAGEKQGEFYGAVFQDSDVAKWLEAVAYTLAEKPDKELKKLADSVIELIGRAQEPDGYFNTYFILKEPGQRFRNLREGHELYTLGHMIEAAVAYKRATGEKRFLEIVQKIVIPILPVYIAFTFCSLAYEGTITKQAPIFISVILIVMAGHYIWMALLYTLAGIYSGRDPRGVIKHYGPAYLTAVGTMSSAATLAVALSCAKKAEPLRDDMVDFGIPLFANIHLCGSVLTEVFFVMTVSKILYGALPDMMTMVLFCVLLGVFAVGAPGVPGGTVMASLGLITGVLGFDATGTALMLTIFALQDSFGTACNVTGDGALTLMLTGYVEKHGIKHQDLHVDL